MIILPNECLFETFTYLKNWDLFSCLLVNRQWCRIAIPLLWRELSLFRSKKLVRTCLLILNTEEQSSLKTFITFPNNQKPLFDYTAYTMVIKIDSDNGIMRLFENNSHNFNFSNYHAQLIAAKLIRYTLTKMFLRTSKKLKDLSIHCEIVNSLLSRIFDKCTLTSLTLSHNGLGTEGGNVLAEVLHKNTTLTHLYIWGNKLDSQ
ncbi:hypothetical protein F8M41_013771 [Gigaspora margarita]|uniref:F-box domain-containing protein n=1 Tax=Gigaspora margarita TaxID=4874 RepID=A0A8H4EUY5_GIGMA|nr:hypothetical protein F8M41_013771 [Gigaspora margarita]